MVAGTEPSSWPADGAGRSTLRDRVRFAEQHDKQHLSSSTHQHTTAEAPQAMGAATSKPEDVAALAGQPVSYTPPLGPPKPGNPIVFFDVKLGRYGAGTPGAVA